MLEALLAAGAVVAGLLLGLFGTRWAAPRSAVPTHSDQAGPAHPHAGLVERVEVLERALPAWQIEMAKLADAALDVLDQAERKRRAARMERTRVESRTRGGEAGGEADSPPLLASPSADPNAQRREIMNIVRARRALRGTQ